MTWLDRFGKPMAGWFRQQEHRTHEVVWDEVDVGLRIMPRSAASHSMDSWPVWEVVAVAHELRMVQVWPESQEAGTGTRNLTEKQLREEWVLV